MKRRAIVTLVPLLLLFSVACGGQGSQQVDVPGALSFEVPTDLVELDTLAFDSVAGELASASMKVSYDFGSNASAPTASGNKMSLLFVDGREATIHYYEDKSGSAQYPYVSALHVPEATAGMRLTMFVRCADEDCSDEARAIFRTISFAKDSGDSRAQQSPNSQSQGGVVADGDAAQ
jgi:hypothetical protein